MKNFKAPTVLAQTGSNSSPQHVKINKMEINYCKKIGKYQKKSSIYRPNLQ